MRTLFVHDERRAQRKPRARSLYRRHEDAHGVFAFARMDRR